MTSEDNRRAERAATPSGDAATGRRHFLTLAGTALAGTALARHALAQDAMDGITRYPDPAFTVTDSKRFKAKIGNTPIQRLYTGCLWAEGPAWSGVGRYLVFSDIPNNEQLRWVDEAEDVTRRFRYPANNSNGNTFDREGRQISCEHLTRRVVRYEQDGEVTILTDSAEGGHYNAPNDAVVHPQDGSIWFTDPGYGSLGAYEGTTTPGGSLQPFRKEAVWRIDGQNGRVTKVAEEPVKPNGLCFSPDYTKLYVADTGITHYENAWSGVWSFDVDGAALRNPRQFVSAEVEGRTGFYDGLRADIDGNLWIGAGWVGEGYDGVHIVAPDGARMGQIRLPEICANVCFGGEKRNRLFMCASQSLYAVYTGTRGAHFC